MNTIQITGLTTHYPGRKIPALRDIELEIPEKTIFAIIGESGAGKTTLAKIIAGLQGFSEGQVNVMGHKLIPGNKRPHKAFYKDVQYMFQHAALSFNPDFTCRQVVMEPMRVQHIIRWRRRKTRAMDLLSMVGLERFAKTNSRELSGGQTQRLAMARALAMEPGLIIADEVTAGLDTHLKLDVIDLMRRFTQDGLTVVFITHELMLAKAAAQYCAVIYRGMVVETGPVSGVLVSPGHPYTRLLLSSSLDLDNPFRHVPDYDPGLTEDKGCPFMPNCPYKQPDCAELPELSGLKDNRVRCHHPLHK